MDGKRDPILGHPTPGECFFFCGLCISSGSMRKFLVFSCFCFLTGIKNTAFDVSISFLVMVWCLFFNSDVTYHTSLWVSGYFYEIFFVDVMIDDLGDLKDRASRCSCPWVGVFLPLTEMAFLSGATGGVGGGRPHDRHCWWLEKADMFWCLGQRGGAGATRQNICALFFLCFFCAFFFPVFFAILAGEFLFYGRFVREWWACRFLMVVCPLPWLGMPAAMKTKEDNSFFVTEAFCIFVLGFVSC